MKTLIYSTHGYDKPFLENAAKGKHELDFTEEPLNVFSVKMAKGYEAISIFSNDNASDEILQKLAQYDIKFIALRSVGFDHVDLDEAEELGIKVANVPEYSPYSIAEHSVALLLALNRKLYQSRSLMQLQNFKLDSLVGFDLNEKFVGIIGTGKIGIAFARIMHGFGCKILAYDPVKNPLASEYSIRYTSLEVLLTMSDVVSLHCPLNSETENLLDIEQFAMMKKGAILINTARGKVISTFALLESLEKGHLGGACLDVYEKEKGLFFNDHQNTILKDEMFSRLQSLKNVIITGHQAFLTNEALKGIADTTIFNLSSWSKDGTSENDLN